jgi:hypothetical protein
MNAPRSCQARTDQGKPCRQAPLTDKPYCYWHEPSNAAEAAEARRLGGLRRRREGAVRGAYAFAGLDDIPSIRRLLEVAAVDVLSAEPSIAKSRTLVYVALAAARLHETGELEQRLAALEAILGQQHLAVALPEAETIEGTVLFTDQDADTAEVEP